MADRTARDEIERELDFYGAFACRPHERNAAIKNILAALGVPADATLPLKLDERVIEAAAQAGVEAVMAALRIPVDTPMGDIRAGLELLRMIGQGYVLDAATFEPDHVVAYSARRGSIPITGRGSTPAAAVLALAAKLEASDA